MKLNFKEWNIVYEALKEKEESLRNSIKWQAEYEKEHDEESECMKEYKAKHAAVLAILKRLEDAIM